MPSAARVSRPPFNLKDLRQIAYSIAEIDAARGRLARQLQGALGTEAAEP
jgi:hypothetical protein